MPSNILDDENEEQRSSFDERREGQIKQKREDHKLLQSGYLEIHQNNVTIHGIINSYYIFHDRITLFFANNF